MTRSRKLKVSCVSFVLAALVVIAPGYLGYRLASAADVHAELAPPPTAVAQDAPVASDQSPMAAEPRVVVAMADTADAGAGGGAGAPAGPAAATPAPVPDVDPGQVAKLWKSGAFLAAGTLTVFLMLTLALKFDPKRAFYYTAALTGGAGLVDMTLAGHKLTWSAAIVALTTIVSLLIKGPGLRKT